VRRGKTESYCIMKNIFKLIALLSCICTCFGCQSVHQLKDGFYIEDKNTDSALRLVVTDPQGKSHEFAVIPDPSLFVVSVLAYSLKPYEEGAQVQISGVSTDPEDKFPILVIRGKPYVELSKSSGAPESQNPSRIPVTITIKVSSESEAELIKTRLEKKFGIEPK
jgi:hypothetical protein